MQTERRLWCVSDRITADHEQPHVDYNVTQTTTLSDKRRVLIEPWLLVIANQITENVTADDLSRDADLSAV